MFEVVSVKKSLLITAVMILVASVFLTSCGLADSINGKKVRKTIDGIDGLLQGVVFSEGAECGEEVLGILNEQIQALYDEKYSLSFVCVDMDTKKAFSYNADWVFCSQSTIKAPFVLSLLDAKPEAFEENKDAIREIITKSSNSDYENLRDKYGTDYIVKWCEKAGVSTEITDSYYPRNITVKDLAKLWTLMYNYLNNSANEELVGWFFGSAFSSIYRALGDKYHTWTKAGWEEGSYNSKGQMEYRFIDGDPTNDEVATNDTGVVFSDAGNYILTIFTNIPADTTEVEKLVLAIDAVHADMCG